MYATIQRMDKLRPESTEETVASIQLSLEAIGNPHPSSFDYGVIAEVIGTAAD